MRRIAIVALALSLAFVTSGTAGCGLLKNPNEDANKAIAEANTHLKKYQDSLVKVGALNDELRSVETTAGGAVQALDVLARMRGELAAQKTELETASKAIAKVKTFEVDAAFKKYADLEIAAIAAKVALADANGGLYSEMERMYTAIRDKKSSASLNEILSALDAATNKVTESAAAHQKANDGASAFFDKMVAAQK